MDLDEGLEFFLATEPCIRADINGESKEFYTDQASLASDVREIVQCMARLKTFENVLFLSRSKAESKQKKVKSLEKAFLNLLTIDFGAIKDTFPCHEFNPFVGILLKHAERLKLELVISEFERLGPEDLSLLREITGQIKVEINSVHVQNKLKGFRRSANKNFRSLSTYVDLLFERYARMLVIRVDFTYRSEYCLPKGGEAVTHAEARTHREELLKYFRGNKSPEILGYAWKLEYGLDKSYHYHFLLFLNGATHREDIVIAKVLGEYWIKNITCGKGIYYNCNKNKAAFEKKGILGVGMISHNQAGLRAGLKLVVAYLTKPDYFIRMIAPDGGRCFGKGGKASPKDSKRGRPRLPPECD